MKKMTGWSLLERSDSDLVSAAQAGDTAASQSPDAAALPDDIHRKAADALLKQIWDVQPGQAKFDAIDAVVKTYKASDAATKDAISAGCA